MLYKDVQKQTTQKHQGKQRDRVRERESSTEDEKKTHEDKLQHSSVTYGESGANINIPPLCLSLAILYCIPWGPETHQCEMFVYPALSPKKNH